MAGQTLGDVLRRIGRQAGLQGVLTLTDAQSGSRNQRKDCKRRFLDGSWV